jgi:diguanylate cyclase (GGDEF)-like protein
MTHATAFSEIAPRPALPRVLALVALPVAAQSPDAACAWAVCLAIGLVIHWLGTRSAAAPAEPAQAVRERPEPTRPSRRRTDAVTPSVPGPRPLTAESLLNTHRDNLSHISDAESLADTAERLVHDLQPRGHALCVLHVGLNGFEPLIESYGREAEHQVLVQVDRRLRHIARSGDTVFRLGDTEFVLLISGPADESKAFLFAMKARVAAELQRPFAYRTLSNLHINCSVGFAIWPTDGASARQVIRQAEESLAEARSRPAVARRPLIAQPA